MKSFVPSFRVLLPLLVLLFGVSLFSQAQEDLGTKFQRYMDASTAALTAKDMPALSQVADDFRRDFPTDYTGYAFKTFYYLTQNDLENAERESKLMHTFKPVDQGTYSILAMLRFMQGNTAEAEKLLYHYYQTIFTADISANFDDIATVEKYSGKDLSGYAELINRTFKADDFDYTLANNYFGCLYAMLGGDSCPDFQKYVAQYNQYRPFNPEVGLDATYAEGALAFLNGEY